MALDPDDPEDRLTILAFAVGGSAAEAAGKAGITVGGRAAAYAVKTVVSKQVLQSGRALAAPAARSEKRIASVTI
jgi:hypothetical protein